MSRARTERARLATERWPTLLEVLSIDQIDPEQAVTSLSIDGVGVLLTEWRDWNSGFSWKPDANQYLSEIFELGDDPRAARATMDRIYDAAIRRWRAAGNEFQL